jgi:hypothetical protein
MDDCKYKVVYPLGGDDNKMGCRGLLRPVPRPSNMSNYTCFLRFILSADMVAP